MFTGLIEETGTLQSLSRGSASCVLTVGCREVLENTKIGDSIAVNGVCLTVTSLGSNYFTADAMPETLNRSSLGELRTGSLVNLERAMPADGRFGGHIVSGHIDGTGTIEQIQTDANAVWYTVSSPAQILRYIVEKGSITIDGISLTVAYVDEKVFKVSIIPHTQKVTALHEKHIGSIVNLECDIIGKYVEKLLSPYTPEKEEESSGGGLTEEFLRSHGF